MLLAREKTIFKSLGASPTRMWTYSHRLIWRQKVAIFPSASSECAAIPFFWLFITGKKGGHQMMLRGTIFLVELQDVQRSWGLGTLKRHTGAGSLRHALLRSDQTSNVDSALCMACRLAPRIHKGTHLRAIFLFGICTRATDFIDPL